MRRCWRRRSSWWQAASGPSITKRRARSWRGSDPVRRAFCFDAFSSRGPVPTSLANALKQIAAAEIVHRQENAFEVIPPDHWRNLDGGLVDRRCDMPQDGQPIVVRQRTAVIAAHT